MYLKKTSKSVVYDFYPLILACNKGDFPLIERMLRHGADTNATDGCGDSALLCLLRGVSYWSLTTRFSCDGPVMQCVWSLIDCCAYVASREVDEMLAYHYIEARSELDALLRAHASDRKPVLK